MPGLFKRARRQKQLLWNNDALASGGTTNPEDDGGGIKFCCSNMDYVVGPNHYNEDARRTAKSDWGTYAWKHSFPSGTSKVALYVYLWDPLFTDESACYEIGSGVSSHVLFGYIDQNKAKGGWNYLNTKAYTLSGRRVFVSGSNTSGKRTGADAVKVICTY